jgi:hypothetical protein
VICIAKIPELSLAHWDCPSVCIRCSAHTLFWIYIKSPPHKCWACTFVGSGSYESTNLCLLWTWELLPESSQVVITLLFSFMVILSSFLE